MDIDMPGLNGWQTTIQLKQLASSGQIPVLCPIIAHTAFTSQPDLERCGACGM
jgi:CheY-like chemotaxis protein